MTGKQILQLLLILAALVLMAWLAFYLLIISFVVGAIGAVYVYVRRFLIAKGILNYPVAPANMSAENDAGTIEVEYIEVTTQDKPSS